MRNVWTFVGVAGDARDHLFSLCSPHEEMMRDSHLFKCFFCAMIRGTIAMGLNDYT